MRSPLLPAEARRLVGVTVREALGERERRERWRTVAEVDLSDWATRQHAYAHRTHWIVDDSVWCEDCGGVVAVADG